MSDEREPTSEAGSAAAAQDEAGEAESSAAEEAESSAAEEHETRGERVDEDGLPLDRDATIDDVRSTEAKHGRYALGCALAIVLAILAFWAIRAGLIG